jgi:hypothetical protein
MEDQMNESPDQQLKERIIGAIKKNGIIDVNILKRLENKYMSKGISAEDWIHFVESEIRNEEANEE